MLMEEDLYSVVTSLAGLTDLTGSIYNTSFVGVQLAPEQSYKYAQLLAVIEEMASDLRPSYAGNKSSFERLKRGVVNARLLVRECLMETERIGRL